MSLFDFTSTSSHSINSNDVLTDYQGSWTIESWVYFNPTSGFTGRRRVFFIGDVEITVDGDGILRLRDFTIGTLPVTTEWSYLVISYSKGRVYTFLVRAETGTSEFHRYVMNTPVFDGNFSLGVENPTSPNGLLISEFMISKRLVYGTTEPTSIVGNKIPDSTTELLIHAINNTGDSPITQTIITDSGPRNHVLQTDGVKIAGYQGNPLNTSQICWKPITWLPVKKVEEISSWWIVFVIILGMMIWVVYIKVYHAKINRLNNLNAPSVG